MMFVVRTSIQSDGDPNQQKRDAALPAHRLPIDQPTNEKLERRAQKLKNAQSGEGDASRGMSETQERGCRGDTCAHQQPCHAIMVLQSFD